MSFLLGATLSAQDALPTPKHAPTPPVQVIRGDLQVTSVAPLGDILLTAPRPGEIHGPENDFAVITRTDYVPGVIIQHLLADDDTVLGFSREGDIYRTEDGVEWELETSLDGDAHRIFARAPEEPHFMARTRIIEDYVYWEKRPGQTWEMLPTPAVNHSRVEVVWHQGAWHFFDTEQILRLDEGVFTSLPPLPETNRLWTTLEVWREELLLVDDAVNLFVSPDGQSWAPVESGLMFADGFLGLAGDQLFTTLPQGIQIGAPDTGWTIQNLPSSPREWITVWRDHYVIGSRDFLSFVAVDDVGGSVTTRGDVVGFSNLAANGAQVVCSTDTGMARAPIPRFDSTWGLYAVPNLPGDSGFSFANTWAPHLFWNDRLLVTRLSWRGPPGGRRDPEFPNQLYVLYPSGESAATDLPDDFHTHAVVPMGSWLLARGERIGEDSEPTLSYQWSQNGLNWTPSPADIVVDSIRLGSAFHVNGQNFTHYGNLTWRISPTETPVLLDSRQRLWNPVLSTGNVAFATGPAQHDNDHTMIYRSTDGVSWMPVCSIGANNRNGIAAIGNSAVVSFKSNTMIFAPDGENWFAITLPLFPRQAVISGGQLVVGDFISLAAMPLPRLVFAEAEPLGDGWVRSDWYGALWQHPDADNYWHWHPAFGWQWIDPVQLDTGFWAWDHAEGWTFLVRQYFPEVYRANEGAWIVLPWGN